MTREELDNAILWGMLTMTPGNRSLGLLIEAAEAHLKTMPEPVTTYVVTAIMWTGGVAASACRGYYTRAAAEDLVAEWKRDPRYSDIKITEIVNRE